MQTKYYLNSCFGIKKVIDVYALMSIIPNCHSSCRFSSICTKICQEEKIRSEWASDRLNNKKQNTLCGFRKLHLKPPLKFRKKNELRI